MDSTTIGVLGIVLMLVLMFVRVPLAISFLFAGLIGLIFLTGFKTAANSFSFMPYTHGTMYVLSCLPMFILLGLVIGESRVGEGLYSAAYKWVGRLPGSLAIASLVAIAFFSAVSGSAFASLTTFAPVAYPEMRRFRYDQALATGAICVGATMDIMIPPSLPMIFYAMLTEASIGKLFIAGFIPGALEVLLFALTIIIMAKLKPSLAPRSTDIFSFKEKVKSLKGVGPILIIFLAMFGGMYAGVFTPTEAGAVGAILSFAVVLLTKAMKHPWKGLLGALKETVRTSGTITIIVIGVMIFNTFVAMSGVAAALSNWIVTIGLTQTGFLIIVFLLYILLGALLDEVSMVVLTVPFYMPAINALGIDVIWFGILIILAWQTGMILPPVGLMAFIAQKIVKEPTIETVYKGCIPFAAALVVIEALVILFPEIALFLPNMMAGK
ncbi:MAG: C4-dicarboxylate transporter permease [Deltaproteobacteria bacterium]|nr:C4-dicarboxylate transporter permease [Deltaproteobacteria bacterium]